MKDESVVFHAVLNDNFEVLSHLNQEDLLNREAFFESRSARFGATPLQAAALLNRLSLLSLFTDRLPKKEKDALKPFLTAARQVTKLATSRGHNNLLTYLAAETNGGDENTESAAKDSGRPALSNETAEALTVLRAAVDIAAFNKAHADHLEYLKGFKMLGLDFDHDGYRVVPPDDEEGNLKVLYDFMTWSYNRVSAAAGGSTVPPSSVVVSMPGTGGDNRQPLHHHEGNE